MPALTRAATLLLLCSVPLTAQRTDTVVRQVTRPVHAGVAALQREISIGVADGDERYMLGSIADIAVGHTGSIYVWDGTVPAIRMYDAAGKYVKTIGRRGSGPGEYQSGAGVAIAPNGNLLIWDPGNARINVYTSSGDVVTSWPTLSGGSGTAIGTGLLMVDTTGVTYAFTLARPPGGSTHEAAWIRFRPDGSLKDTLFALPGREDRTLKAESPGGRRVSNRTVPFTPQQYTKVSPLGYFVTGYSNRIALDIHEPGKPLVSIRRDVALQPVSAKERDSARADIFADMHSVVPSWSWNGRDIPNVKPAYTGFTIAADGRFWVQLAAGPSEPDTAALGRGNVMITQGRAGGLLPALRWSCPTSGWLLFDVYEPAGRYLGQVRIPERVDPLVMRGDVVWAATCSDDDVPMVARYRIAWR